MKIVLVLISIVAMSACSSAPKPTTVDGKSREGINSCIDVHLFHYQDMARNNELGSKTYVCNSTI